MKYLVAYYNPKYQTPDTKDPLEHVVYGHRALIDFIVVCIEKNGYVLISVTQH